MALELNEKQTTILNELLDLYRYFRDDVETEGSCDEISIEPIAKTDMDILDKSAEFFQVAVEWHPDDFHRARLELANRIHHYEIYEGDDPHPELAQEEIALNENMMSSNFYRTVAVLFEQAQTYSRLFETLRFTIPQRMHS